jgi:hypothetical protein
MDSWLSKYQNPAAKTMVADLASWKSAVKNGSSAALTQIANTCFVGQNDMTKINKEPSPPLKALRAPYKATLVDATTVYADCLYALNTKNPQANRKTEAYAMVDAYGQYLKDAKTLQKVSIKNEIPIIKAGK